jgi:hypothetical protein
MQRKHTHHKPGPGEIFSRLLTAAAKWRPQFPVLSAMTGCAARPANGTDPAAHPVRRHLAPMATKRRDLGRKWSRHNRESR